MTKTIKQLLTELIEETQGLRIEVKGWRVHTSSAEDFILHALDARLDTLNELKAKLT